MLILKGTRPVTLFSQLGALDDDDVIIASGQTIYLDGDTPSLGSLTIEGTLIALDQPVSITAGYVEVGATGELRIGTEANPFTSTAAITLTGAEASRTTRLVNGSALGFTNDGVGRSLQVIAGGKLTMVGSPPTVLRTKLNATAANAATSFTLADSVSWASGDAVVIGPTDFYGTTSGATQAFTLASAASGTSMTTTAGITGARWGVLQYATDTGMSLTAGTFTKPHVDVPEVLDERAPVINLTRNIVVQGADDSAWSTSKFGGHCMFMGLTSEIKLDGVEFRRMGQAGAIGRYPIHWHMNSYNMPSGMNSPSDGTFLGVKTTDFVKRCSVHQSGQRAIVIHGTHGITVDRNVCHDIIGHAIFLEDSSEQDNTITDNVVLKVRKPTTDNTLVLHDKAATASAAVGTSGIWLGNPDNTLTGNWVADAEGCGIWNSFPNALFGLSSAISLVPRTTQILSQANNTSHSNGGVGMATAFTASDARGNLTESTYQPTGIFTISTAKLWKNTWGGYQNRVLTPLYDGWTQADNERMDFFGQAQFEGVGRRHLCIAESLNNSTSRTVASKRSAFATYHEVLNFQDCVVMGYEWIDGAFLDGGATNSTKLGGGVFRLSDLYVEGVTTFSLNDGITQINCETAYRSLPPHLDGETLNNRHWTLSGAIYDVNGIFVPAGRHWIYDNTFLTYNAADLIDVDPAGTNGKHTSSFYYGVGGFTTDFDTSLYTFLAPMNVTRLDGGVSRGVWNVADGATSIQLGNMRHFAAQKNGRYLLEWPGNLASSYVKIVIACAFRSDDFFTLGVAFDGASTITAIHLAAQQGDGTFPLANATQLGNGQARAYNNTGMTSIADVEADATGTKYWQDTANDVVWIRIRGGLTYPLPYNNGLREEESYQPMQLGIVA